MTVPCSPRAQAGLFVAMSLLVACVSLPAAWADDCDTSPTGVERTDYPLHFTVPAGLMPDRRFDGRFRWTAQHTVSWPNAHATIKAALIEWITAYTFAGEPAGRFAVSPTGAVNRTS